MRRSPLGLKVHEQSVIGPRRKLFPTFRDSREMDFAKVINAFSLVGYPEQVFPLEDFAASEDQSTRATIAGFNMDASGRIHTDQKTIERMARLVGLPVHSNGTNATVGANALERLLNDPKFSGGSATIIDASAADIKVRPVDNFLDAWDRAGVGERILESRSEKPLLVNAAAALYHGWRMLARARNGELLSADPKKISALAIVVKSHLGGAFSSFGSSATSIGFDTLNRNCEFVFGTGSVYPELIRRTLKEGTLNKDGVNVTGSEAAAVVLGCIVEERESFPIHDSDLIDGIRGAYGLMDAIEKEVAAGSNTGKLDPDDDNHLPGDKEEEEKRKKRNLLIAAGAAAAFVTFMYFKNRDR